MDITTLALAKAYTDEKVKEASTGEADLSEYAKKEDIPSREAILQIVKEGIPDAKGVNFGE